MIEEIKEKSTVGKMVEAYFSNTPKWAKIVRFVGIGIGAIGGALMMTNPVTAPAAIALLIPYSGYMTFLGNLTALIVQGFSENK